MLAVLDAAAGAIRVQLLDDDGRLVGAELGPDDILSLERDVSPRWLWADAATDYRQLLRRGITVGRCHDLLLTERILAARADRYGEPVGVAAILARRDGRPVPLDGGPSVPAEPGLFDTVTPTAGRVPTVTDLVGAYRDQLGRIPAAAASPDGETIPADPAALRLLIAAESASGLVAAEMGHLGMPWRVDVHERVLTENLGGRPASGERPPRLAELAAAIDEAFGYAVNPDSPADLRTAFRRAGHDLETTRSWVLKTVDHPAVASVLAYKELQRLHTANGWNWISQWVRDGRFHADYVPGGVITGRWATRGGGALQIPKIVRRAVVAEPGYRLVVADAAQLEPRVLIAVSDDRRLGRLAEADDLYTALAQVGFSGRRDSAKVAMLGAMYGATTGQAGQLLGTLRTQFPVAMDYVERAARRGEQGKLVSTVLGRASHRPGPDWQSVVGAGNRPDADAAQERRGRQAARAWGRFTRNFVIQGSAADWAAVWLSTLRRELRARVPAAELVFFQHDELMVHTPIDTAPEVAEMVNAAAAEAGRLVFPQAPVGWRVPVRPSIVECYADAK